MDKRKKRENGHDTQTGGEEKEREKTGMIHRLVGEEKKERIQAGYTDWWIREKRENTGMIHRLVERRKNEKKRA